MKKINNKKQTYLRNNMKSFLVLGRHKLRHISQTEARDLFNPSETSILFLERY